MNWQALRDLREQGFAPRTLLDIGAHLGGFSKPFTEIFPGCSAVLVEPNPHCAAALSELPFEWHAVAASDVDGEAELHLTQEWLQSTGASLYRENTPFFRDEVLTNVKVPKRTIDGLLPGRRFDFVKIDTQGAELDVLRGGRDVIGHADFILIEVSLVDYNAGGARAEDVFAELALMGFDCAGVMEFHRLQKIAGGGLLQMDFLFKRRSVSLPRPSSETRAASIEMAERQFHDALARMDFVPAISSLTRLRDSGIPAENFTGHVRALLTPLLARIGEAIAQNDVHLTRDLAGSLTGLLPNFGPAQLAAMRASAQLGDAEAAGTHARRVLAISPNDIEAANVAARAAAVSTAPPSYTEALERALFPKSGLHPLLHLRDVYDAASAILCTEARDDDLIRVQMLLEAAPSHDFDLPPGADYVDWRKHFHLAMRAIKPSFVFSVGPTQVWEPPAAFASGAKGAMTQEDFVGGVSALNPQAIFFAAADVKYMGLYARHFVESIRRNCDVPYAIVLHVVGGARGLPALARSLPDADGKLFLTADDFDAASVTAKCFDTPPKGHIEIPVAHYQSARFQRLGWMIKSLARPIFISDIDLLLQYGIADLLRSKLDCDVVFNENEVSFSAGSRLTANLTLVNPTPNALIFAGIVKNYLDEALAGDEVSRWIDQFGLLMALHKLRRRAPGVRVGYFDTKRDINNIMYRSYEKNPFRFLSLFHGFDMSTLEQAA